MLGCGQPLHDSTGSQPSKPLLLFFLAFGGRTFLMTRCLQHDFLANKAAEVSHGSPLLSQFVCKLARISARVFLHSLLYGIIHQLRRQLVSFALKLS